VDSSFWENPLSYFIEEQRANPSIIFATENLMTLVSVSRKRYHYEKM